MNVCSEAFLSVTKTTFNVSDYRTHINSVSCLMLRVVAEFSLNKECRYFVIFVTLKYSET